MPDQILNKITERIRQDNAENFSNFNVENFIIDKKILKKTLAKTLKEEFTIIAEIKKASPSKGVICKNFKPAELAQNYQKGGAGAISVLTESNFFQGSPKDLQTVSATTVLPILRKDFIIDISQIYESRNMGADIILLIACCLSPEELYLFHKTARSLDLETIVEVHNEEDLNKALGINPEIIGINNRNLKDFSVSMDTSLRLGSIIPDTILKISESGIKSSNDTKKLINAGFSGALIGETLVSSSDPAMEIKKLKHEI